MSYSIIGSADGPTSAEFGFSSAGAFLLYGFGNVFLMLVYWIVWMLYFYRQDFRKMILLAVIPVCMFILSGVALGHVLLIISGVIFGIGHISVTLHENYID